MRKKEECSDSKTLRQVDKDIAKTIRKADRLEKEIEEINKKILLIL